MASNKMFEYDNRLSQQTDYCTAVVQTFREKVPLLDYLLRQSLPGAGNTRLDYIREIEAEPSETEDMINVAEGEDWTPDSASQVNSIIRSTLQSVRSRGYRMTQEAIDLNHGRISVGKLSYEKEKDARRMLLAINSLVLSQQEAVERVNSKTKVLTRALGCWLQPGSHSVYEVPAELRPANEISGTEPITQVQLEDILEEVYLKCGHEVNLTGFVGIGLKRTAKDFLNRVPTTVNLRRNVGADENRIKEMVDILEFDTGMVQLVLCNKLYGTAAASGKTTPYEQAKDCGYFLQDNTINMEWIKPITDMDMSTKLDTGGGPRGYHRAMFRINSIGMQTNFRVIRTPGP